MFASSEMLFNGLIDPISLPIVMQVQSGLVISESASTPPCIPATA